MTTSVVIGLGVIYALTAVQYLLVRRLDNEMQEMRQHHQQAAEELFRAKITLAKALNHVKKEEHQ